MICARLPRGAGCRGRNLPGSSAGLFQSMTGSVASCTADSSTQPSAGLRGQAAAPQNGQARALAQPSSTQMLMWASQTTAVCSSPSAEGSMSGSWTRHRQPCSSSAGVHMSQGRSRRPARAPQLLGRGAPRTLQACSQAWLPARPWPACRRPTQQQRHARLRLARHLPGCTAQVAAPARPVKAVVVHSELRGRLTAPLQIESTCCVCQGQLKGAPRHCQSKGSSSGGHQPPGELAQLQLCPAAALSRDSCVSLTVAFCRQETSMPAV